MSKLKTLKESECSCKYCQSMCRRPCWGTPEEIKKIIDSGFGDRLMLDYWTGDDIDILCGALKGEELKKPFWPSSEEGCTFWKNGLCELHDLKLKPCEGRLVNCDEEIDVSGLHKEIAMTWDTEEGKQLVREWKEKYMKGNDD